MLTEVAVFFADERPMDGSIEDPLDPTPASDVDDGAGSPEAPAADGATICPHLHLLSDPLTSAAFVHAGHACFKAAPPTVVVARIQERFCLSGAYAQCPVFRNEVARPPKPARRFPRIDRRQALVAAIFAVILPAVLGTALALLSDDEGPGVVPSVSRPAEETTGVPDGDDASSDGTVDPADPTVPDGDRSDEVGEPGGSDALDDEAPVDSPGQETAPDPALPPLDQLFVWPQVVEREVFEGDTLSSIAAEFGTTVEAVVRYNGLPSDGIFEGQTLLIPVGFVLDLSGEVEEEADGSAEPPPVAPLLDSFPEGTGALARLAGWPDLVVYTVQSGDSLLAIAGEFGTSAVAIAVMNELAGSPLAVGQALVVAVGYDIDLTGSVEVDIEDVAVILRHWPTIVEKIVEAGDVLALIAQSYGTSSAAIRAVNALEDSFLFEGQVLLVPVNFELEIEDVDLGAVGDETSGPDPANLGTGRGG
jgi:LysM repeat protein